MKKDLLNIFNDKFIFKFIEKQKLPEISKEYLKMFEILLKLHNKSKNDVITNTLLKQLIKGILLEIKYPTEFKESNKELIKWVLHSIENNDKIDHLLFMVKNSWTHHNHPITVSLYYMETIPEVRKLLKKFN